MQKWIKMTKRYNNFDGPWNELKKNLWFGCPMSQYVEKWFRVVLPPVLTIFSEGFREVHNGLHTPFPTRHQSKIFLATDPYAKKRSLCRKATKWEKKHGKMLYDYLRLFFPLK